MKKAIATPPGQPEKYVDLTPAEQAQRQKDAERQRKPYVPRFEAEAVAVESAADLAAVKAVVAEALRKL